MLSATVLGSGTPIVLLPGFALDAAVMAAACEPALAQARPGPNAEGWQRIYLDLPGTGGSPGGEPTSEAVLVSIRDTVAELLGDTPFGLVGHSFGSYLAAGLARRDPDLVAGLFLICPGRRIRPVDRDLAGVQPSVPEPGWLDDVSEGLHEHFGQAVGRQTKAVADRVAVAFDQRGPVDEEFLEALRPNGYQLADEAASVPFGGPVSLLSGRRDRIAGYKDAFATLDRYPNGSFAALAEAGHYLPFEEPEHFAVAILDWLTSGWPRAG